MAQAQQPEFYTGVLLGSAKLPGTVDTSLTAPTNVATIVASAAGPQGIYQLRFVQLATTSTVSYVNLFLYDGATYNYFDAFALPIFTMTPGSAQASPIDKFYRNLDLPAGWSLRATTSVVSAVGNVLAFGGN